MTTSEEHALTLYKQLLGIEPGVTSGGPRLFPCAVELINGTTLDCVYMLSLADARRFKLDDGLYRDGAGRWIKSDTVRSVSESPSRFPRRFASEINEAGESGMGYWAFTVTFTWWRRRHYVQSFLDFIAYPRGLGPPDVRSVKPHAGKREFSSISSLDVHWCAVEFPADASSAPGSVTELTIPAGAQVYLGAPAVPMAPSLVGELAAIVSPLRAVVEAHLPQCWAPSAMNSASQILVVVMDRGMPEAVENEMRIRESVARACPPGQHLDIWFIRPDHFFLGSIRAAGCRIK